MNIEHLYIFMTSKTVKRNELHGSASSYRGETIQKHRKLNHLRNGRVVAGLIQI